MIESISTIKPLGIIEITFKCFGIQINKIMSSLTRRAVNSYVL